MSAPKFTGNNSVGCPLTQQSRTDNADGSTTYVFTLSEVPLTYTFSPFDVDVPLTSDVQFTVNVPSGHDIPSSGNLVRSDVKFYAALWSGGVWQQPDL